MAKFCGIIGFGFQKETAAGVWEDEIVERRYYGDIIRHARKLQTAQGVNDDVNVSNEVEIVADPFAGEHFYAMRYVTMMGTRWKITNVEVRSPRLVLTIGGVYNGRHEPSTPTP